MKQHTVPVVISSLHAFVMGSALQESLTNPERDPHLFLLPLVMFLLVTALWATGGPE